MGIAEARAELQQRGIEYLLVQFVDLYGVPRAKLVPADHAGDLEPPDGGAFFQGFATYGLGHGPHETDMAAIPDWSTLTPLPWAPKTARVAADLYRDGRPWKYCPRTILRRQVERAAALGYTVNLGIEPEFYLLKVVDGAPRPFDDTDTLSRPCYDVRGLSRALPFLQAVIHNLKSLGWDVYATDHEDANGQFEINFAYAEALTTADRYVFFRYMVGMMAREIGAVASFMPKPWANATGNGAHMHVNLADKGSGENLFARAADGSGLSELGRHFMAGILEHAQGFTALAAPTVNSYKRLVSTPTLSGSTWAPVVVAYGGNNRTQMLRIPAAGRIEVRVVDGHCNPYLAAAALIAAGLDGVERKAEPGSMNDGNMYALSHDQVLAAGYSLLPSDLRQAVLALSADEVLVRELGEDFVRQFVQLKLMEWSEYHSSVSQWEIDRYLTLL